MQPLFYIVRLSATEVQRQFVRPNLGEAGDGGGGGASQPH